MEFDVGTRLEPDVTQPPDQLADRDAQIHPGEIRADATVRPSTESDVPVPLPL